MVGMFTDYRDPLIRHTTTTIGGHEASRPFNCSIDSLSCAGLGARVVRMTLGWGFVEDMVSTSWWNSQHLLGVWPCLPSAMHSKGVTLPTLAQREELPVSSASAQFVGTREKTISHCVESYRIAQHRKGIERDFSYNLHSTTYQRRQNGNVGNYWMHTPRRWAIGKFGDKFGDQELCYYVIVTRRRLPNTTTQIPGAHHQWLLSASALLLRAHSSNRFDSPYRGIASSPAGHCTEKPSSPRERTMTTIR